MMIVKLEFFVIPVDVLNETILARAGVKNSVRKKENVPD